MPIPVCVRLSDLFYNFPECSIFYTILSFKILNVAVKCSRRFFLKAPIRPLLKLMNARTDSFLASAEIISMLKYKKFFKLGARKFCFPKYKKLFKSDFFCFSSSKSCFLKYKKVPFPKI